MKIRNGFVSNSSSSSFLIISTDINDMMLEYRVDDIDNIDKIKNKPLYVNNNVLGGETFFNWQIKVYNDFASKLNFAMLQIREANEASNHAYMYLKINKAQVNSYYEMLISVLKEMYGITEIPDIYELNDEFGIEHASSILENKNMEMFDSRKMLVNFLFNNNSYIVNRNDNDYVETKIIIKMKKNPITWSKIKWKLKPRRIKYNIKSWIKYNIIKKFRKYKRKMKL